MKRKGSLCGYLFLYRIVALKILTAFGNDKRKCLVTTSPCHAERRAFFPLLSCWAQRSIHTGFLTEFGMTKKSTRNDLVSWLGGEWIDVKARPWKGNEGTK